MTIIGSALVGTLLFLAAIFLVIVFGAAANKWGNEARELTEREQRKGLLDDVPRKDRDDVPRGPGPHVPTPA
ncbi:hypothetical protein NVS55_04250 [Myxococcus stipitatus]|uniref:hypothetical protein n=1 Tax=Myxococcus stipitatus TaxID=83455 RepID=UPI003144E081